MLKPPLRRNNSRPAGFMDSSLTCGSRISCLRATFASVFCHSWLKNFLAKSAEAPRLRISCASTAAVGAKPERGEDLEATFRTFHGRYVFKTYHSRNLFQGRHSGSQFVHCVVLHGAHPIRSRDLANLIRISARTDHRPYGIIEA